MTEFPLFLLEKSSILVAWFSCQCRICAITRKVQNVKIPKNDRIPPVFTWKFIDFRRFHFVSVSDTIPVQNGVRPLWSRSCSRGGIFSGLFFLCLASGQLVIAGPKTGTNLPETCESLVHTLLPHKLLPQPP